MKIQVMRMKEVIKINNVLNLLEMELNTRKWQVDKLIRFNQLEQANIKMKKVLQKLKSLIIKIKKIKSDLTEQDFHFVLSGLVFQG